MGVGERDAEGVRDVEAVAVADEHALLVEQIVAELFGGYVEIVVNEICCTVRVGVLVEIRIFLDPLVDDDLVGVHDLAGALEDLVDVLKRDGEDPLIKNAAADGVVGAPVEEPLTRFCIMADDPADARSGHGVDLGRTGRDDGLVVEVDERGHIFLVQAAVHLVADDPGIHAFGNLHELPHFLERQNAAGGVVGVGEEDRLGVLVRCGTDFGQIELVAVLDLQVDLAQLRADGAGDGVELLVVRHDGDDVVCAFDERVANSRICAGAAVAEDNLVGLDIFVELGERFARAGRALEAGIAEIHVLEFFKEVLHALACEVEKLFDRHRQHATAAEIVLVFLAVAGGI